MDTTAYKLLIEDNERTEKTLALLEEYTVDLVHTMSGTYVSVDELFLNKIVTIFKLQKVSFRFVR